MFAQIFSDASFSIALDKLGNREEAIVRADAALKILEAIEAPDTSPVRDLLAKWRGDKIG